MTVKRCILLTLACTNLLAAAGPHRPTFGDESKYAANWACQGGDCNSVVEGGEYEWNVLPDVVMSAGGALAINTAPETDRHSDMLPRDNAEELPPTREKSNGNTYMRMHIASKSIHSSEVAPTVQCLSPVDGTKPLAWTCAASLSFTMAITLSGYYHSASLHQTPDYKAPFEDFTLLHQNLFAARVGASTLQQLVTNDTIGEEPVPVLVCNQPGVPRCFDVYYSRCREGGNGDITHKLYVEPAVTPGQTQGSAVGAGAWGSYNFQDRGLESLLSTGYDGAFALQLASAVFNDSSFAKPGVSCLNLMDDNHQGHAVAVGWLSTSCGSDPAWTDQQQLMQSCVDVE